MAKHPVRDARRAERRVRRRFWRRILRYLTIAGVGLLGLAIIVGLFLPSVPGIGPQQAAQTTRRGGGPGTTVPDQGRTHLGVGEASPAGYYSSAPPTSGNHAPVWTECGVLTSPLPDEVQVHNLEHGFVMVQYNTQDQAVIDALKDVVRGLTRSPDYLIMAPYPTMTETIALTAWGKVQYLETVDEGAIQAFAEAYRGRGPEIGSLGCTPGGFTEAAR